MRAHFGGFSVLEAATTEEGRAEAGYGMSMSIASSQRSMISVTY